MAYRLGIVGDPNTGKSYSRRTIKEGEKTFTIMPSHKALHLKHSSGAALKPLDIQVGDYKGWTECIAKMQVRSKHEVIHNLIDNPPPKGQIKAEGNYIICKDVRYVQDYMLFADRYLPEINTIIQPDFTHYISNVIASPEFRARKAGGEAFARFWDLAADTLINIITSSDELRPDIIVVTEYHMDFDKDKEQYTIFVPAGNMLAEKFLPLSYYDYCLFTKVLEKEAEPDETKRFKFVTVRKDRYNGRMGELFTEDEIPNDLNLVLSKMRAYLQI